MTKRLTEDSKDVLTAFIHSKIESYDWMTIHDQFTDLVNDIAGEPVPVPESPIHEDKRTKEEHLEFAEKMAEYRKAHEKQDIIASFVTRYLLICIENRIIEEKGSKRLPREINEAIFKRSMFCYTHSGYEKVAKDMEENIALIHKAIDANTQT